MEPQLGKPDDLHPRRGLSRQCLRGLRRDRCLRQLLGDALHTRRPRGSTNSTSSGDSTGWQHSRSSTNKPIAIPEWSDEYRTDGHGLGDDPQFVDNMANWFVTNQVAFANVWSYDSSLTYRNNLLDGTFPKALARFRADFG